MKLCPFFRLVRKCNKECALYDEFQDCCTFKTIVNKINGTIELEQMKLIELDRDIEKLKSML